jgi:tripartite ATP-independent transporter DctM subunit
MLMTNWLLSLILILGSLVVLMALGFHVFLCFLVIDIVGVYFFWGGQAGLRQLMFSIRDAVATFNLLPVPLFVLMGEVMFHSGVAPKMIDAIDKWLGRLPGRLGLLAVAGGTIFATMSGSSMAAVAMLGSTLVPEMEKRGYKKPMSLGPIMGAGPLAIMIPPSALAVILGALGTISIGQLLLAIIFPGLILAFCIGVYVYIRCRVQPELAPSYEVPPIALSEKITSVLIYVVPLAFIIFLVIGIIFLGIATPTEAAATGAAGCFILAAAYKKLSWKTVTKSLSSTVNITAMTFVLMIGAQAFSQILAFTGAGRGISQIVASWPISAIWIVVGMQLVGLILGCFMSQVPIMMITLPVFIPILNSLGVNTVWFGAIYLLNMEIATITPPFGIGLFVMKSVAPPDTTMKDIYTAAGPFIAINLVVMVLLLAVPILTLWLPNLMFKT